MALEGLNRLRPSSLPTVIGRIQDRLQWTLAAMQGDDIAWLTPAAAMGFIGGGLLCAAVLLSADASELAKQGRRTAEVSRLADLGRQLTGERAPREGARAGEEAGPGDHARFATAIDALCSGAGPPVPYDGELRRFCDLQGRREAADLDDLAVQGALDALEHAASSHARAVMERTAGDYGTLLAVAVLAGTTFAAAGAAFVALLMRASSRLRLRQSDANGAATQAVEARDMLREVIETLPAGVVVYDAEERLIIFNSTAAAVTPRLSEPGSIGMTYEQLARETARRLEAAGEGPQPAAEWIAQFRRKDSHRTRRALDGRWFEWSERLTPGGLNVGLRVDVTEIKAHEQAVERARGEYRALVDSLSDIVFKMDLTGGTFTFVSAAAATFFGVPVEELLGTRFLDYVDPDSHRTLRKLARRLANSPTIAEDRVRFRMKTANGEMRHVEIRHRTSLDTSGRDVVVGVIRDVEERVQLERQLEEKMAELERAHGRYQTLVDSLSDLVYAVSDKGIFTYASPGTRDLLSVSPRDLVGTRFRDWVVDDDVERVMRAGRAFHRSPNREIRHLQFRMRTVDGTIRTVELRYRQPVGESADVAQVGVIRDITERTDLERRVEKHVSDLEHVRQEYQSLVDSLSDVIYKLDPRSGTITFASAAAADFFGTPVNELVGTPFLGRVAAEAHEALQSLVQERQDPSAPATRSRFRMVAAGGAMRHVEALARRTIDQDGQSIITGALRDIEERVQLERRLQMETDRLRSVVESSGALIVLVDRDFRITMVNGGFRSTTGVGDMEVVGRPLREIMECPVDATAFADGRTGLVADAGRAPVRFGVRFGDPDGRARLISVTATPVADVDGHLSAIVMLGVDDTERREAEQALHDAERFATVGEMAGTMAHELSQPLQVINIACETARDEFEFPSGEDGTPDQEVIRTKLERIAQQVDSASRIVSDLRAFVRGTGSEKAEPFEPATAVRRAVDLTAHGVRQAGVALTVSAPDSLPRVTGDVGKLEQVLVNLINNARDAGGRRIDVAVDTIAEEGRASLRIVVADTGPGIAPEILPQLFVSFVTTKPRGKGTGLGLRICNRIVSEMGGSITASNRAEGGASFQVLLPAAA